MSTTPPPISVPPDIAIQRVCSYVELIYAQHKRIADCAEKQSTASIAAAQRIDGMEHDLCAIRDRLREGTERFAALDSRLTHIEDRMTKTEEKSGLTTQRLDKFFAKIEERDRASEVQAKWLQVLLPIVTAMIAGIITYVINHH